MTDDQRRDRLDDAMPSGAPQEPLEAEVEALPLPEPELPADAAGGATEAPMGTSGDKGGVELPDMELAEQPPATAPLPAPELPDVPNESPELPEPELPGQESAVGEDVPLSVEPSAATAGGVTLPNLDLPESPDESVPSEPELPDPEPSDQPLPPVEVSRDESEGGELPEPELPGEARESELLPLRPGEARESELLPLRPGEARESELLPLRPQPAVTEPPGTLLGASEPGLRGTVTPDPDIDVPMPEFDGVPAREGTEDQIGTALQEITARLEAVENALIEQRGMEY